jgi:3',5'-cyclic AMP phosphodiesterase CpdA
MKKTLSISILCLFCLLLWNSCSDEPEEGSNPETITFMVLSDIHYFDPALFALPAKADFVADLASDRKMIMESSAILKKALAAVEAKKPGFLLISGDLTKDGEKYNHQELAKIFGSLSAKGIKVLVIPGNHDINNSNAYSYLQDKKTRIDNITASGFASVYANCGYGDALERDPNSLSYVAEPVKGVWVLGIDACHYAPVQETAGSISPETMSWITSVAAKAKKDKKILISMMHHGLMEHFNGQNTLFPGYVVTDWQNTSGTLADLGLKVVFTGHFHANDIVQKSGSSGFVFDIETGSSVTFPSAYRTVTLNLTSLQMKLETTYVTDVSYPTIPSGTPFQTYSKNLLTQEIKDLVYNTLTAPPYNISGALITSFGLDRILTNAVVAHFSGDETPSQTDLSDIQLIRIASSQLGDVLQNVWTDLTPADNNITIDLNTGIAVKN